MLDKLSSPKRRLTVSDDSLQGVKERGALGQGLLCIAAEIKGPGPSAEIRCFIALEEQTAF